MWLPIVEVGMRDYNADLYWCHKRQCSFCVGVARTYPLPGSTPVQPKGKTQALLNAMSLQILSANSNSWQNSTRHEITLFENYYNITILILSHNLHYYIHYFKNTRTITCKYRKRETFESTIRYKKKKLCGTNSNVKGQWQTLMEQIQLQWNDC